MPKSVQSGVRPSPAIATMVVSAAAFLGSLSLREIPRWVPMFDASPKGLRVHSRVSLLQSLAWTPPTLVGTRLYVRDRKNLMALDLGQ